MGFKCMTQCLDCCLYLIFCLPCRHWFCTFFDDLLLFLPVCWTVCSFVCSTEGMHVGVAQDCREIAASAPCYFMPSLLFLLSPFTILNILWFGDNGINKELWIIQSGKKYFSCFSQSPVLSSLTTEETKYCQDLPPHSCKQSGFAVCLLLK